MAEFDDRQTKKLETASLTLGILSLIFYFISSTGLVALTLGIVATVLGNRSRKLGGSVAGFVCGIVGLSMGALSMLEALLILVGFRPFINTVYDLFPRHIL